MSLNRPAAGELLRALAEHLEKVVQPRLSGTDAYQNRIALNLLRILEREAALGPQLINEEQARLIDLLGSGGGPTTHCGRANGSSGCWPTRSRSWPG